MNLLHDRLGIPAEQISLFHAQKQLNSGSVVRLLPEDRLQMLLPLFGGARKRPKGTNGAGANAVKRELVFADEGQGYARCLSLDGNRRCTLACMDGTERKGIIRGSMKRGAINRVRNGDFVLVGLREYEDQKCDIIHKYDSEEVRRLKQYGEIRPEWKVAGDEGAGPTEIGLDDDNDVEFTMSDGEVDDI